MIAITRLPEPAILTEKKAQWKDAFLERRAAQPNCRPASSQYGHPAIRDTLAAMSSHKCFYCERKLDDQKGEVDHYIEVEEEPETAFEWENLYLSCRDCNGGKIRNTSIPAVDCLNPCDTAVDPADHLTFDDEVIRAKNSSSKGVQTIKKYQLGRQDLSYLRLRQLQHFSKVLLQFRQKQIEEGRTTLTADEKEILAYFKAADHAYSLMFTVVLAKFGL